MKIFLTAILVLGAASGQQRIPPEATIIETAPLNNRRGLVLWMLHPKAVRSVDEACSDWVYGDHWAGPARLSLVDSSSKKVINTIAIRGSYGDEDSFPIPFRVSNSHYSVAALDSDKRGKPRILNLRDLTGEGVAGQFVLFEYEACGAALTSVFGYSPGSDRVQQYQVEVHEGGKPPQLSSWVPHAFGENPHRPGVWDFTWEPGHGSDCTIHEQVSFDPERRVFVDLMKITPDRQK